MSIKQQYGYSLVELLVALVISLIVMGGIYLTSVSQERNLHIEDRVAELQANLRAGMYMLERDLRLAGYDPMCVAPPCYNVGFIKPDSTAVPPILLTFSMRKPDTNTIQTISYSYDSTIGKVGRAVGGSGNQPLMLNVDALDFVYFDNSGNRLGTPLSASDFKKIKVVEVTIVAHSEIADPNYTSTKPFKNLRGDTIFTPPANDHYRRRSISSRILCRNAF